MEAEKQCFVGEGKAFSHWGNVASLQRKMWMYLQLCNIDTELNL